MTNLKNELIKKWDGLNKWLRYFLMLVFYPVTITIFVTKLKINRILKGVIITITWIFYLSTAGNTNESLETVEKANTISVVEETKLSLSTDYVELYEGQTFNPNDFIDNSIHEEVTITNDVDVTTPGEYTVLYNLNGKKATVKVVVLSNPIVLKETNVSLEKGIEFNPNTYVESSKEVTIVNNVDTSQAGVYSVVYSYDGLEKTLWVTITDPKTVTNVISSTDWTKDIISKLGFTNHEIINMDTCNLSGNRETNVAVDVGFGDRLYWAFTNEYGQLVAVIAEKITLQDETTEELKGEGRYCTDEAKVPGTEASDLDEGHVIADSLGGVSNAYNITPQNSTLNRYGDQAYMESVIRTAGGVTNFVAIITYPNTVTQTPSHYSYTYVMKGNIINDEFDNINPEKEETPTPPTNPSTNESSTEQNQQPNNNITSIDKNGNGTVTIKEAEDAGYSMPIYSDHWLYPYMIDRDNDGMVGESN